jgi:hypothetical protein
MIKTEIISAYAGRVGTGIDQAELERRGGDSNRSRPTRCRSTWRRRAQPASVRR